jgi:mitochondrial enoyl-[acyl-carrier protein] reductase / trans-2-enoyl-CoA reductase
VAKVPSDIPVEYAANLHSALTAHKLLEGLGQGDVVVQADADSTVGLAVVQLAKLRGVVTVNIVADGAGYYDRAGLVKELGGDVVVTDTYAASSPNFAKVLGELGKPKAAFSEGSALPPAVGAKAVTYGPGGQVAGWLGKASAAERAKAIEEVAALFRSGALHVWVERHPFGDMKAALAEAKEPFKARKVVLVMNEPAKASAIGDLDKLQADFEAAFQQLRA